MESRMGMHLPIAFSGFYFLILWVKIFLSFKPHPLLLQQLWETNVEARSNNCDNKNNQFYERRDSLDSKPRLICRTGTISKKLSAILRKLLPRKEWEQCPWDFILSFQHTGYEFSKTSTKCFERKLFASVFLTRAEVCVSPSWSLFPKILVSEQQ